MSSKTSAVRIVNFTKRFGSFTAVDNLNLEIYDREIFGFLGPNGSGKTTTLLTIATVYKPTSGDIYVYGHSVTKEDYEVRKLVGIAFQDPKALWIDKVQDLLEWHARVVGLSRVEAKNVVKEVLETLELWDHRNKYFYQLSGGTRKKVELAKVLIQRPRLAILDEPTAQVDVPTKHKLWDIIKMMRDEGSTIIIATNDMFEAEKVCERIGIIYKGRLVTVDTISGLKDKIPKGDVIEVTIEGDGLRDRLLSMLSEIGRVDYSGNVIRVFVERAEEKALFVADMLRSAGVKVKSLMIKEPTLDDVFMYFTGARLIESSQ
ncbi:ABC transporter related protein [Thermogladius calderae 1633]|uniref:ABC transporter related protein n=1 Tax=Thermogladius calderae (strain DSM 22663 / VKM B-2946 / 1633) TaxID=1184251 RepID=I3TE38_THEC1|nr:ATP-binding cassette domain-containing protein [Thermogladius calderae]AFK51026.1 ABC transporter related protein [Thermogladius calderae 1633]